MSYPKDELPAPALAHDDERSFELARLWFAAGAPRVVARAELWPDPAAWGFVLGEMARDLARMYAEGGEGSGAPDDAAAALARIRAAFDAELDGDGAGEAGGMNAG